MVEFSKLWLSIDDSLLSAIFSIFAAIVFRLFSDFFSKGSSKKSTNIEHYSNRLAILTESLLKASAEVDNVLSELATVAVDREKTIKKLEVQLKLLEEDERNTQKRIQDLQSIPVSVADHFAAIVEQGVEQGEKRSAKRDYLLFGLGVIITTVVSIILTLVF